MDHDDRKSFSTIVPTFCWCFDLQRFGIRKIEEENQAHPGTLHLSAGSPAIPLSLQIRVRNCQVRTTGKIGKVSAIAGIGELASSSVESDSQLAATKKAEVERFDFRLIFVSTSLTQRLLCHRRRKLYLAAA
jgi:hypothetical protein